LNYLQKLSICNINKHNTRGPRLQSGRIVNYIDLNLCHTTDCTAAVNI